MTAPMIDPGVRGDESMRRAAARETVPEATTRFADLLAREATPAVPPGGVPQVVGQAMPTPVADRPAPSGGADPDAARPPIAGRDPADPMPDLVGAAPGAQARLFNQDGFFGRPDVIAAADAVADAAPHAGPIADPGAAAAGAHPPGDGEVGMAPVPVPAASPPLAAGTARASVTRMAGPAARPSPVPVARAPAPFRPADATRAGKPAPPARPAPRPVPSPTAAVAVALHAAARGIEVAAQVAGLNERDRAALADEIAALLSAHGYAPAQVSVIAAPRAARQEHR